MRRWPLVFLSLAILALIGMAACSSPSPALTSQPDTEPSPTAAAFVESTDTSIVSTPTPQESFPPSTGRQLLPTLSLEDVPETPLAVPTFDRAAALPTPRLPAGMNLHSAGLEIITAENVGQLELVAEIRSEDGINSNVAFSPDNRWLVAGSSTGIIHVWDVATGIESGSDYTYYSRPIINGGTVYFEPYAFELATGDRTDFAMSRTYNCGIVTGSKYLLAFRSGTLGFVDVSEPDEGTRDYGGIRPGCWINALPVGGMVLMPDATARCNCSYLMNATIALAPRVSM